jgi:hypothetical protein
MTRYASDRRTRTRTRTTTRSALKFFNSPERPGYYGPISLTASVVRRAYGCVTEAGDLLIAHYGEYQIHADAGGLAIAAAAFVSLSPVDAARPRPVFTSHWRADVNAIPGRANNQQVRIGWSLPPLDL